MQRKHKITVDTAMDMHMNFDGLKYVYISAASKRIFVLKNTSSQLVVSVIA